MGAYCSSEGRLVHIAMPSHVEVDDRKHKVIKRIVPKCSANAHASEKARACL